MRTKKGFVLRNICGENIIVGEGVENVDFSKVISMNDSAAYLWKSINDEREFDAKDLASLLCQEYEVSQEEALKDAKEIANEWLKIGIVEE